MQTHENYLEVYNLQPVLLIQASKQNIKCLTDSNEISSLCVESEKGDIYVQVSENGGAKQDKKLQWKEKEVKCQM